MTHAMPSLSTHVLDTAHGRPAAGLRITLSDGTGTVLAERRTNADGRLDGPILPAGSGCGIYELRFFVAEYFRAQGVVLPEPAFLDEVPIRFGMAEALHYHVPLLVSPFGYSTYRGS